MHNYEQFTQMFPEQFDFAQEDIKQEQYAHNSMDSYSSFDAIPYTTEMFSNGQQTHDFKFEMLRTTSQNGMQQSYAEAAPSLLSSTSAPSLPSASSSTVGSPHSGYAQPASNQFYYTNHYGSHPAIYGDSDMPYGFESGHIDHDFVLASDSKLGAPSIDPVLISGPQPQFYDASYAAYQVPQQTHISPAPSPAPSIQSYHSFSAPVTISNFGQQHAAMRRQSVCSGTSPQSTYSNDDDSNKGRCTYPDCGKVFKDLKAHRMTHEMVRPEKCPIVSCEYHIKGFSRKYDKNRHTLTHYRGTMVCGFCPGSGSAAEKSFNRADVFKRHLTSVHGVEQTPPNSRKRSPSKSSVKLSSYCQDATGKCSTCGASFNNAQDFYEHLDDCVLKVVQQEDPSEAINARSLTAVANDAEVQATFERNNLKLQETNLGYDDDEDDEEDDDEDEDEEEDEMDYNERSGRGVIQTTKVTSNRAIIGGNISKKSSKKGLTWSKGGGRIIGKSRKRRKFYPPSWGMATDKMNMRKRVLCVYDGGRRLLKDDMMMHNEYEVRVPLNDGNSYVTDLDLETMKRAEAFHNATPEEKGPWIQEQDFLEDFLQ